MSRTNIDIDDDACIRVMHRFGLRTKREAVNFALRELAVAFTVEEARRLRGSGWEGDLEEMRSGRVAAS
jgi:Arc/MetJ family transcription regulator